MYKMHPDDLRKRDIEFLVHGKLLPFCQEATDGPWAMGHEFPCAQPKLLAKARAEFYNDWPPTGQPLDVEGLEAAFELAQQRPITRKLDCARCGTTLSKDNRSIGLCSHCARKPVDARPKKADLDLLAVETDKAYYEQVVKLDERREELLKLLSAIKSMRNPEKYRTERTNVVDALKDIERRLRALSRDRELNLSNDDRTRKLGPMPYELQQYHRAARAAGLRHKFAHDGIAWFVDCHDGSIRPPETAWTWLRGQNEIYHVPSCCVRLGGDPCGVPCGAQRKKAGVTLDDWLRIT